MLLVKKEIDFKSSLNLQLLFHSKIYKMKIRILLFFLLVVQFIGAQVGIGTITPSASALIDIKSDTKGVILPRLNNADRNNINKPAKGLLIFNLESKAIETNVGTPEIPNWVNVLGITGLQGPSGVTSYGTSNVPTADGALALGGSGNIASGVYSSVMGGTDNKAEGGRANDFGGSTNIATGTGSNAIGGGTNNHTIGADSNSLGGSYNTVNGVGANALGGFTNNAVGTGASCLGGSINTAGAPSSSVLGGISNNASEGGSAISGGSYNGASGTKAIILGGTLNNASANETGILGGNLNSPSGVSAVVAGGFLNSATSGSAGIIGGNNNSATAVGTVVMGGENNSVTGTSSSILGGKENSATGIFTTVSGGVGNYSNAYAEWRGGLHSTYLSPGSASSAIANDRFFTIGNGTPAQPSNALMILKNGFATLPSGTKELIAAASEKAIVTKEFANETYAFITTNIAPTTPSDTGKVGEIRVTPTHIYTCIATNSWVRKAAYPW